MDEADLDAGRRRWQRRFDEAVTRDADFTTLSGLQVDPVYGPPPGAVVPGLERIGLGGQPRSDPDAHATAPECIAARYCGLCRGRR